MTLLGQILPGTEFGDLLTELAKQSTTIVEVGSWRGGGSTKCLASGLIHPEQRMWGIDADRACLKVCRKHYCHDTRIKFFQGTICTEKELLPFIEGQTNVDVWRSDRDNVVKRRPLIDEMPKEIGLLLLDGGDYCSHGDFELLHPRSHFIALDDTNTIKNRVVRQRCLDVGWRVIADRPHERHGWFVCERIP